MSHVPSTDYERIAPCYDADRQHWQITADKVLADLLRAGTQPINVLDIGCGTGNWLAAQARHFGTRPLHFFGVDPSTGMLERAPEKEPAALLARARAEKLPFAEAIFDYAFSGFAFHHFEVKEQAVREIARVLKPEGRFRLRSIDPWSMRKWWVYRFFEGTWEADERRFWPVSRITSAFENLGFSVKVRTKATTSSLDTAEVFTRAENRVTSQLAILDDSRFREGIQRLRHVLEAGTETIPNESAPLIIDAKQPG